MNNMLLATAGSGYSVTVTGAMADTTYNGDGHVVGPNAVSKTLGTSDGGTDHPGSWDIFISSNPNGTPNDRIVMKFSFPIYSVSFDYEIFPDGTCPDMNHCAGGANLPDLKFMAGPIGSTTMVMHSMSAVPVSPNTHSPNSGMGTNEMAPQMLGMSGTWTFAAGVKELDFIDWPQKIGIDNLRLNIPEPSTLLLLASGLAGLAHSAWKKRR